MKFSQSRVNQIVAHEKRALKKRALRDAEKLKEADCRTVGWYFWKFVHNMLIHPFLGLPFEPKWAQRAHDWTALRCKGGG